MTRRAHRTERRSDHGRIRVTERDLAVLEALGRMKFSATRQLSRLAFRGSRWACVKRLRCLFDAGLIRAWVPRLDGENIYSLAPAGARRLGVPPSGAPRWPTPRGLDGHLDHLLAANACRIALALTLPETEGEILWWRADWELAAHFRERVIPDGLFRVRWDSLTQDFALEIDHASRAPRAFVTKMLRYQGRSGLYGLGSVIVLAVGREAEWVERYRQAIASARLTVPVWFAALAEVEAKGALAPWRSPQGEERPSLRALLPAKKGDAS